MRNVYVEFAGKSHTTDLTDETFELIMDGADLRDRPVEYYFNLVVTLYSELTEENILKYMDEHWIL